MVERPVGEDFRDRLGVDAGYVPNGWDPDLARAPPAPPPLDERALTLVHTGKLTGEWGRHPGSLFEALRRMSVADPETPDRLQLVLAGRLDREEERLIEQTGAR